MNFKTDYTKELQNTCSHLASCTKDTTFIPTKYGGVFKKGNREISCNIDYNSKFINYDDNFKIKKTQNGFGLKLNKKFSKDYARIQKSVYKGLGIK